VVRKKAIWALLILGLGLIAAPLIFNMWVRAPRGAEMISDFKPYMTQARASQYNDDYLPAISLGYGSVPTAIGDAAARYGRGARVDYPQAVTFLQGHPALGDLANIQQNFPTMAAPFTNMVGIMVRDVDAFNGVAGLPPFWLFPFFFTVPGLILVAIAVVLLRRARGASTRGRAPQVIALVLGLGLAAAPFLPMPPGWGLMWHAAPPGAHMIDDFGSPNNGVQGSPPVMSHETVTQFNGYLSTLLAGRGEILPAIQAVAAQYGTTITATQAKDFLTSDPKLTKLSDIEARFPTMYASFHGMMAVMEKDVEDYQAVQALPPFTLFPYFFIIPGLLVAAAAAVVLGTDSTTARAREYDRVRRELGLMGSAVTPKTRV
jgi:hypothetical protein